MPSHWHSPKCPEHTRLSVRRPGVSALLATSVSRGPKRNRLLPVCNPIFQCVTVLTQAQRFPTARERHKAFFNVCQEQRFLCPPSANQRSFNFKLSSTECANAVVLAGRKDHRRGFPLAPYGTMYQSVTPGHLPLVLTR